jgi:hypothetical protein
MSECGNNYLESQRPLLGVVGKNGAIYFAGEPEACREFLRQRGLAPMRCGWEGDGWRGLIDFEKGVWYAAAWRA